jgi:hypothetical protein
MTSEKSSPLEHISPSFPTLISFYQMPELPTSTRALVLRKRDPVDGKVYHAAEVQERPLPALQQGQVLVRVSAAGFNRRDVSS